MEITTRSAIDISESLASYLFASYLNSSHGFDPVFEKRLKYVDTAKYTIADVFLPRKNVAFEVKSVEHGTTALKGVIQSSIYMEQADKASFVMQKPRRRKLRERIENVCKAHDVGVIWLIGIPTICSEQTIKRATGGNTKPFELWKKNRFTSTRAAIVRNSRTEWADEFIATLDQVVQEKSDEIFEFSVKPDPRGEGFSDIY